jgi:hypothetical protein
MLETFSHLNYLAVLAVSVVGFILGGVWYSRALFGKAWMTEMKLTEEQCKKKDGMARMMILCFLLTVVSTTVLAALIAAHRTVGPVKGAAFGLMVGAGLIAVRYSVNSMFESRSLRHVAIVAGHDIVLCLIQGALLGVWR